MTTTITRKFGRPSWLTPFGHEGFGDVFFDRLWPEWRRDMGEEWSPSVDIFEKNGKYHIKLEVPGVEKDDITVSLEEGFLTISGKKDMQNEENAADYHVKETKKGFFSRRFQLPGAVDTEKVDASYKDGILTVVLPRKDENKIKKIDVH